MEARPESTKTSEIKAKIANLVSFDPGINQKREFSFKGQKLPEEQPVLIYTRAALLGENLDYLKEDPKGQMTVLKFDIANFHACDLAKDKEGNSAGDLVLNRFARRINQICDQYKERSNVKINAGRYGGDEFAISIFGDYDEALIRELTKNLNDSFPQSAVRKNEKLVRGYFKKGFDTGAPIEEKLVTLKETKREETIEIVKRPEQEFERKIFDHFLEEGLALNTKEIAKIKSKYSRLDEFEKYVNENQRKPNIATFQKKLDNIIQKHPRIGMELKGILASVQEDDQKLNLITYAEKRLFDQLLGDIVLTPTEFFNDLSSFSKIYCLDMKLIKELNDSVSYVDGDLAIKSLWQQIREKLKDNGQVNIGRRGGTFFIGVKKTTFPMTKETIRKNLEAIQTIKVNIGDKEENLKVGYGTVDLQDEGIDSQYYSQKFSEMVGSAENQFYLWLIDYLSKTRKIPSGTYTGLDFVFPQSSFSQRHLDYFRPLDMLIDQFIISKRAFKRSMAIVNLLKTSAFSSSKYDRMKRVMKTINQDSFTNELSEEGLKTLDATAKAALF